MTNVTLLFSSTFSGIMFALFCLFETPPLRIILVTLLGTLSSICNHGLSNKIVKWVDRILMIKSFFFLVYTIGSAYIYSFYKFFLILLICSSGFVYYLSKYRIIKCHITSQKAKHSKNSICVQSNALHIYSHTSSSLAITSLILLLNGKDCFRWIITFYTSILVITSLSIYKQLKKLKKLCNTDLNQ